MQSVKSKINPAYLLSFIAAIIVIFSCSKEFSETYDPGSLDITSKVTVNTISGYVTDDNNQPVKDAAVVIGNNNTITDKYGYFKVKNAEVTKNASVITVNKAGFFPGIRTIMGESGKSGFTRIKLIPKTNIGTIAAATGGNVTATGGLKIALPATAVVNAATGAAYSGNIQVAAHWIDPSSQSLFMEMPGDLRGISTNNSLKVLTTYGMAAVELTGDAGEKLQIATGKKATLTFPIPTTFQGPAPATIPMWSFDEAKGLWKEEGIGTKTGNTYVAEVSHFSFWNCDVPANYVDLSVTLVNQNGSPLAYTPVKITEVSNPANTRMGHTDSAGYVHGLVPANTQLKMEVFAYANCGSAIYSQTFSTTAAPLALGTITVTVPPSQIANITATLNNCSGTPVTNGFLVVKYGYHYYHINVGANGTINSNIVICNSEPAIAIAEDITNMQQSAPINFTLAAGNNTLGTILACGTSTAQFLNYSIGANNYSFTAPADSLMYAPVYNGTNTFNAVQVLAFSSNPSSGGEAIVRFNNAGLAAGSTQTMLRLKLPQMTDSSTTAIPVNITEYGTAGQFIAGNFSGTFSYHNTPSSSITVVGSFRVRRY